MYAPPNLPMSDIRMLTAIARLDRLDYLCVYDHFQDFYPTALWDRDFTWAPRVNASRAVDDPLSCCLDLPSGEMPDLRFHKVCR